MTDWRSNFGVEGLNVLADFFDRNEVDDYDFEDTDDRARYCEDQLGDDPDTAEAPFLWKFITDQGKKVSVCSLPCGKSYHLP